MPQKENTSKFGIVAKIMAVLKIDDAGKVDSFIGKTVKTLKSDISSYNRNIATLENNHKNRMELLDEEIEDAELAVADAYTNVDPEMVKTNESQRSYMDTYLSGIDKAEAKVKALQNQKEKEEESHKEAVEEQKKEIEWREARIKALSKK